MSRFILKIPNRPPHEHGFPYRQHETGASFIKMSYAETAQDVLQHRLANGLPRATYAECEDDVIEQVCLRYGPTVCESTVLRDFGFGGAWEKVKDGTVALAKLTAALVAKGSAVFVSQQVAEERATACVNCFARAGQGGCVSCGSMNLVRKLIAETTQRSLATVPEGSSCSICECLLSAKLSLTDEIIRDITTERQAAAFAEIPWCPVKSILDKSPPVK